jgi:hypothetical protein
LTTAHPTAKQSEIPVCVSIAWVRAKTTGSRMLSTGSSKMKVYCSGEYCQSHLAEAQFIDVGINSRDKRLTTMGLYICPKCRKMATESKATTLKCMLCGEFLTEQEHKDYLNKCGACAHDTDDFYNNQEKYDGERTG